MISARNPVGTLESLRELAHEGTVSIPTLTNPTFYRLDPVTVRREFEAFEAERVLAHND